MAVSVYVRYEGTQIDWLTTPVSIALRLHDTGGPTNQDAYFTITGTQFVPVTSANYETSVEDLGGGVYRLKAEYTASGAETYDRLYIALEQYAGTGFGAWDIDVWGAQVIADNTAVNLPLGTFPPYMLGNTADDLRVTTIADYTIFANRAKTPALDSGTTEPAQAGTDYDWYVFVQQFFADSNYDLDIYRNGVLFQPTASIAATGTVGTNAVVSALDTNLGTLAWPGSSGFQGSLWQILGGGGTTSMSVEVKDGLGDRGMVAFSDEIEEFTDLPANFVDGRYVKITGQPGATDDYWVKFTKDAGAGSSIEPGTWNEANEPGRTIGIDGATMPHVLIRRFSDGTASHPSGTEAGEIYFTFEEAPWADSTVGDDTTNEWPFYRPGTSDAEAIQDVFLYKSRLGFLCGDRVILSDITDLWNFWKTSVRDLVDSDRIVATAAHPNVSILHSAIPVDERLVVFSDQNQFVVSGQPLLTPSTVEIVHTAAYESYADVKPVSVGSEVYFGTPNGAYSGLMKLIPVTDGFSFQGFNVSEQVPQYVLGEIQELAASSLASVAFMLGSDQTTLYFYKWFVSGSQQIQSAWGSMPLDQTAIGLDFIQEDLFVLSVRDERVYLERMSLLESQQPEQQFTVHLDHLLRQDQLEVLYSSGPDETVITLPYTLSSLTGTWHVLSGSLLEDKTFTTGSSGGKPTLTVSGNIQTAPIYVGKAFDMKWQPTLGVLTASDGTPFVNAQHFISTIAISIKDTIEFDYTVTQSGSTWTNSFAGDPYASTLEKFTGVWRAGALVDPYRGTLEFQNSGPYPSNFQSLDLEPKGSIRGTRL